MHSLVFPVHTQDQQRQLQNVDLFVPPNRLPGASHRQNLTLACTRIPSKRPSKQHTSVQLQTTPEKIQWASYAAYPKGHLGRHQTLLRQILFCVVSSCTTACILWPGNILTVSQTVKVNHIHKWTNNNKDSITCLSWVVQLVRDLSWYTKAAG